MMRERDEHQRDENPLRTLTRAMSLLVGALVVGCLLVTLTVNVDTWPLLLLALVLAHEWGVVMRTAVAER
jgi:hypothetical protein